MISAYSELPFSEVVCKLFIILHNRTFVFPVAHGGINIGRRKCVWLVQQRNHGEQNGAHSLSWIPSFTGQFTAMRIVDRCMQYANAQFSVLKI